MINYLLADLDLKTPVSFLYALIMKTRASKYGE